ncbi:MAG: hypothetical protein ABSC11_10750 [Smithella sp.]
MTAPYYWKAGKELKENSTNFVIPDLIQYPETQKNWIPACAGMTSD